MANTIRKTIAIILLCCIIVLNVPIESSAMRDIDSFSLNSDDKQNDYLYLKGEDGQDDIILVRECLDNSSYSLATGSTNTFQYRNTNTNQIVCIFSVTVGYSYDNADGNARITVFSYQISYVANGYSMGNFEKTTTVGNPANAMLTYSIYYNNSYGGRGTCLAQCYNNGSIYWY